MPAFDGVISVRVFPAPMLVEPPADAAGRELPAVRVAGQHPLPGILQQFLGIDRIVIQTDDRQVGIDAGKA